MTQQNHLVTGNPSYSHIADWRAVPRVGYMVFNSPCPAFTHERLDQTCSRYTYDNEKKFVSRGTIYPPTAEIIPSMTGQVIRSPQRRTAGSTTETSTDHLKDLSRKIYVKSLGRQTYEHYYVGSLHTEGILSRCLRELNKLLANYGTISNGGYYSENASLRSCLDSMWTRIIQVGEELEIADVEIAALKDENKEQVEKIIQLEEELEIADDEIAALKDENEEQVEKPSYTRRKVSDPTNKLKEIYNRCRALEDENEQLKLKLKKSEMLSIELTSVTKGNQQLSRQNKELQVKCNKLNKEKEDQMKHLTNYENQLRRYEEKTNTSSPRNRQPRSGTSSRGTSQQRSSSMPRKEQDDVQSRIHYFEKENERLSKEYKRVAEETTKWVQKCEKLSAEIGELQSENSRIKRAWKKCDERNEQLQQDKDDFQNRISKFEDQIARQKGRLEKEYENTNIVFALNKRLRGAEKENATLSEKRKQDAVCLDELTKEREKLQRRISDLEDQAAKQAQYQNKEDERADKIFVLNKRLCEAENEIAVLEDKEMEDAAHLHQLAKEKDKLQNRLSHAEHENAALKEKGRKDIVHIDQLENERDTLQNRIYTLEDQVAKKELRLVKEDEGINKSYTLNKRLNDAETENTSLKEKGKKDDVRLDQLAKEKDNFFNRLSEVEQDNAALTDKGRKDAVRIDQLENERDKLQDRLKELQSVAADQEKRLVKQKASNEKCDSLTQRLNEAENEKATLVEKLKQALSKCDELKKGRNRLQNRLNDAETENRSLKEKRTKDDVQLAQERDKLFNRLSDAEKDNAALTEKGRKDDGHIDQLENERDTLRNRVVWDVCGISELENQAAKTEQRLVKEGETINKLDALNFRLRDAEKENTSLKEKAKKDAVRLDRLESERDKLENKLKELQSVAADQEKRLVKQEITNGKSDSLTQKLNEAENEKETLVEKLKQALSKCDQLKKEGNILQHRLVEVEGTNHRLENMMKDYRDKIKTLEQEKDALLTRLSQYTSAQLVQDNPNVADLSDLNRPTKLAEKFSELYDNDWTDAFEVLMDQFGFSEEQAIKRLYDIVTVAYNYCIDTAEQQVDMMKKALTGPTAEHRTAMSSLKLDSVQLRVVQDLRKQTSQQSLVSVKKGLIQHLKTSTLGVPDPNHFISYIDKCAELCWYMVLPSPPLFVAPAESPGGVFDKNKYRFYQTSGKTYSYIVWPALYLFKDGTMLAKGIAEAM